LKILFKLSEKSVIFFKDAKFPGFSMTDDETMEMAAVSRWRQL
jgi:hypothetical protein